MLIFLSKGSRPPSCRGGILLLSAIAEFGFGSGSLNVISGPFPSIETGLEIGNAGSITGTLEVVSTYSLSPASFI